MKKFKEFVKKIGNKKRCLLSLLLAGLLLLAIVGGLKGSKSAKTEVNAISVPTNKNLDLNGVTYTYQTSLNELKKNYNLFTHWSYNVFSIKEDSEGVTELYIGNIQDSDVYNDTQWLEVQNKIKNAISIEYDDVLIESIISTNENKNTKDSIFEFANAPIQTEITGIKINCNYLFEVPYIDEYFTNNIDYISVIYLNDDNENDIIIYTYSNYLNAKEIYYKFKKINGYSVMGIIGNYNAITQEKNTNNTLWGNIPVSNFNHSTVIDCLEEGYFFINELEFYNDYFTFKQTTNADLGYNGYLLLSENNYDNELFKILENTIPRPTITIPFRSSVYFGGNFNQKYSLNNIYLYGLEQSSLYLGGFRKKYDNFTSLNDSLFYKRFDKNTITYRNQNRLLYLSGFEELKATYNNKMYDALSAQIDDVLYNVDYIGTQEEVFDKKVEDDFNDLLKTTGIGAVIGLLIGFLSGNPIGGLVVGAVIGFAVAIIPLIIDGLQALFGYDFLSGLYNFFNAITEFFVNIIDTIVNFLLSIITNPFVLVLIVLVAILYIFVIRPKIK